MASCTCVYLHGFLSSQQSQKGQWFKETLPTLLQAQPLAHHCQVLTPDYPMSNPHESVDYLEHFLKQAGLFESGSNDKWFFAGSSMGGFYAQYLAHAYNKPYIMINPALDPMALFEEYEGEHINPYTSEKVLINQDYRMDLKDYYQHPSQMIPSLLLLDKGDEVIDYQLAERLYNVKEGLHKTLVFEGGDHRFQHLEASKELIKQFIQEAVFQQSS